MDRLESVNQALDKLVTFLAPALPLLNCDLNQFYTEGLWNKFLPEKLRQSAFSKDLLLTAYRKIVGNLSWSAEESEFQQSSPFLDFNELDLDALVYQIRQMTLLESEISVPVKNFQLPQTQDWDTIVKGCDLQNRKFDSLMSIKKEHEVKIMSEFVAGLSKRLMQDRRKQRGDKFTNVTIIDNLIGAGGDCASVCQELSNLHVNGVEGQEIKYLIDVGSGKGYLSCFLTLLYRFNVLAIDSSPVNDQGSRTWTANVHRIWKNVRNVVAEGKSLHLPNVKLERTEMQVVDLRHKIARTDPGTSHKRNTIVNHEPVVLKHLNLMVREDVDLDFILNLNFRHGDDPDVPSIKTVETSHIKSENPESGIEYGLLGLHTCGSLGSDSVKLFSKLKNVQFLCNVPCCFHFLEERDYGNEMTEMSESYYQRDFPLSRLLIDKQFNLGTRARTLASHSPHRIIRAATHPTEAEVWIHTLHYRALLQVIIQRKLGHIKLEQRLGRKIGSTAKSFVEYIRMALTKLCLQERIQITDAEIEAVEQEHETFKEQFMCFHLLRSMFAPLLDGCVLLDRLAYLLQQESVQEAHIVQLFDPEVSPRCQALVAFRKFVDEDQGK